MWELVGALKARLPGAALALAFLAAHAPVGAVNCKKGIRCGDSCIAANKVCRLYQPLPPTASRGLPLAIPAAASAPPQQDNNFPAGWEFQLQAQPAASAPSAVDR